MKLAAAIKKCSDANTEMKVTIRRITPEFAAVILEHFNGSNRPHSKAVSKLYANEMLRGQWKPNGEPIIFGVDEEGNEHLISGQHRLHALLLVKKAIESGEQWGAAQTEFDGVIVGNVPMDAADSVDKGKARNHTDVLFRHQWLDEVIPEEWNSSVKNRKLFAKTLAGAARQLWLMQGGATISSAPKFLLSEMIEFLQTLHPQLPLAVASVLNANEGDGGNQGLKMSLPHIAAVSYAAACVETEEGHCTLDTALFSEIEVLIDTVAVGTGFDKGSAAHALTGLWNSLKSSPGTKDRDREWIAPFIRAIKAHLAGETELKASNLKLSKKEFENYTSFPDLLDGWHAACYERAAEAKAAAKAAAKDSKPESPVAVSDVAGEDLDGFEDLDDNGVLAVPSPRAPNENGVLEFEDVTDKVETPRSRPQRKATAKRPAPKRKAKSAKA